MMIEEKNIKIRKINLIQIQSPEVSKGIHIIEIIIPGPGLDQGQEHILIIIIQIEIKIIMSKEIKIIKMIKKIVAIIIIM